MSRLFNARWIKLKPKMKIVIPCAVISYYSLNHAIKPKFVAPKPKIIKPSIHQVQHSFKNYQTTNDHRPIIYQNEGLKVECQKIEEDGLFKYYITLQTIDSQKIGQIAFYYDPIYQKSYITSLMINPNWQHQGFGRWLLQYAIQQAQSHQSYHISLIVTHSNQIAQNLYYSEGFKIKCSGSAYLTLIKKF